MKKMKIVSACLAGVRCGYDGEARKCPKVVRLVRAGKAVPVCPEQLGGLSTPRPASERQRDGRVVTVDGIDVTAQFARGAKEAVRLAELIGCEEAIVKARSPMCGSGRIYDGSFSQTLIDGDGVFVGELKKRGVKVLTDEEI